MKRELNILANTIESMAADAEDAGKENFAITLTQEDAKSLVAGLCQLEKEYMEKCCCKPYNEFEETVQMMLSEDYKARFVAEYRQTKIRHERLKKFCNRIEAAYRSNGKVEMPKHDCELELLREQLRLMGEYLHVLEIRAEIERIEYIEL